MKSKEELRDLLDHKFRQCFRDREQKSFKVDEDVELVFDRMETIRNSYFQIMICGMWIGYERCGRFKCYKWFLEHMTDVIWFYYLKQKKAQDLLYL